jgi:hypothetical protein
MTHDEQTSENRAKAARAGRILSQLLVEAMRPGFHGSITLELVVQGGTIQHIRSRVERLER